MIEEGEINTRLTYLIDKGLVILPAVEDRRCFTLSPNFEGQALFIPSLVSKTLCSEWRREIQSCFFCCAHDELLTDKDQFPPNNKHRLFANNFPYVDNQIILATADHREEPTADDLVEAFSLQRRLGYIGLLNLRDSGASLPDHLHFEFGITNLPILGLQPEENSVDFKGTNLSTLPDYPGLALTLQDSDDVRLANNVSIITASLAADGLSFNLIFNRERTTIIPRQKLQSDYFPNWPIGSFFLGGLFVPDARQSNSNDPDELRGVIAARFRRISAETYVHSIADVTLPKTRAAIFVAAISNPITTDHTPGV